MLINEPLGGSPNGLDDHFSYKNRRAWKILTFNKGGGEEMKMFDQHSSFRARLIRPLVSPQACTKPEHWQLKASWLRPSPTLHISINITITFYTLLAKPQSCHRDSSGEQSWVWSDTERKDYHWHISQGWEKAARHKNKSLLSGFIHQSFISTRQVGIEKQVGPFPPRLSLKEIANSWYRSEMQGCFHNPMAPLSSSLITSQTFDKADIILK